MAREGPAIIENAPAGTAHTGNADETEESRKFKVRLTFNCIIIIVINCIFGLGFRRRAVSVSNYLKRSTLRGKRALADDITILLTSSLAFVLKNLAS